MIHKTFLIFTILILAGSGANAMSQISPFRTNGCSFFPEGTTEQKNLWHCCCVVHDFEYWAGGSAQDRAAADDRLFECMKDKSDVAALFAYVGVRANPRRWGNAWRLEQSRWVRQIKMSNWQTRTTTDWDALGTEYINSYQQLTEEDRSCLTNVNESISSGK